MVEEIRQKTGNDRVICGLSGGVDSSVAAVLTAGPSANDWTAFS
jgi:GMP synthase (glutamine-hydrolysing)